MVCTVGAALRLIERYLPLGGKIVAAIVDLSWTLATMFAVPVLAYENLGPVDVLRRSSRIFRQRWGMQIGGIVGINVASVFLYLPFIVLLVRRRGERWRDGRAADRARRRRPVRRVIAVQSAMDQVFRVFVYRSAVGLDTSAGPFSRAICRRRSRVGAGAENLAAVGARELDQQAHAVAGGALVDVGAAEVPRRAGDVQVRPRHLADEVRQERAADDRARLAAFGGVVEVAVGALDQLRVLLVQRQAPDDLAGALAGVRRSAPANSSSLLISPA